MLHADLARLPLVMPAALTPHAPAPSLQPPSLLHPGKACNLDADETLALVNASRALLAPITAQGQTHADMARLAHEAYGSYSRPFRMHYARAQGAVVTPTQELLQVGCGAGGHCWMCMAVMRL